MPNNDPQDLITVIVALLAMITGQELANLIGPYAGIAALATAGAAVSLSGNEQKMTNWQACGYVSIRVLAATVLTVGVAELLQMIAPWAKPRYSLIPLAFGIGWIRDYNTVRTFLGDLIGRIANKRVDDGK